MDGVDDVGPPESEPAAGNAGNAVGDAEDDGGHLEEAEGAPPDPVPGEEADPDGAPPSWARQPGEPINWFRRFEAFRMMPDRSVLGCYRQWLLAQAPPGDLARRGAIQRRVATPRSWREAARIWRWRQRAEDWDIAESQRIAREFEAERAEDRRRRLDVLRAYRAKLTQALAMLDPRDATWKVVTEGLAMVTKELRTEYEGAGFGTANLDVDIELKWNDRAAAPADAEPPAETSGGSRERDAGALPRESHEREGNAGT